MNGIMYVSGLYVMELSFVSPWMDVTICQQAISKDPAFSKCKLIAEPWDCGGLYQVGSFPNWDK